jgi:hypothetical protein
MDQLRCAADGSAVGIVHNIAGTANQSPAPASAVQKALHYGLHFCGSIEHHGQAGDGALQ